MEAESLAKAAEKIGKILGNAIDTLNDPSFWKRRYQNYENWIKAGGGYFPGNLESLEEPSAEQMMIDEFARSQKIQMRNFFRPKK